MNAASQQRLQQLIARFQTMQTNVSPADVREFTEDAARFNAELMNRLPTTASTSSTDLCSADYFTSDDFLKILK